MTGGVDIAIITVLIEEYAAVLAELPGHARDPGEVAPNTYGWTLADVVTAAGSTHRVVVALTGRPGNTSSALAVASTISRWRPSYVLLVGIAGGLPVDGLRLGDVVISSAIWAYEYGRADAVFQPRHDFTYQVHGGLVRSARVHAATDSWTAGLESAPDGRRDLRALVGPIASGDKVVDRITDELFGRVRAAWPQLVAVEMEGGGAAAAIEHARDHDTSAGFLMIRGISDLPGSDAAGHNARTRERWKRFAAIAAARFAVGMIRRGWPVAGRASEPPAGAPDVERALVAALVQIDSIAIRRWVHEHPQARALGTLPAHRLARAELAAWVARALVGPGLLDHAALDRLAAVAPGLDLSALRGRVSARRPG